MVMISVIMPVYNSDKYISESIESILNQTFHNFELIIINDGSTDSSSKIINSYRKNDSRIIFIDRATNKGLPYTLNEGLSKANGKYIARMDSDDISLPQRFEKQFNFLENNKDIYLVGSSYIVFNNQSIKKIVIHPVNPIELAYKCVSNTYFCHPSIMFRIDIFKNGIKYENIRTEDFKFISQVTRIYPCANLKEPLIKYREHNSNYSYVYKYEQIEINEVITKENICYLFRKKSIIKQYFNYRLFKNKSISQYIYCYFIDVIVIFKTLIVYKKLIYVKYAIILIIKILINNFKRLFTRLIK